jgi:hypothetical protein
MVKRASTALDTFGRVMLGLAVLPWCVGATWALWVVIRSGGSSATFWVATLGGATSWVVVFFLLPKPLWLYVVGHELTHAIWAWLCGGRVKSFRVNAKGGSVTVSRSNPLIVLAPYFFPFYAVLWALAWGVGTWLGHWERFLPWFHFGLGFTYAFHVTLTAHILRVRQPDLAVEGWFVSAIVIWLGNVLVLLLTLPGLMGEVSLWTALRWWLDRTGRFLMWLTSAI